MFSLECESDPATGAPVVADVRPQASAAYQYSSAPLPQTRTGAADTIRCYAFVAPAAAYSERVNTIAALGSVNRVMAASEVKLPAVNQLVCACVCFCF